MGIGEEAINPLPGNCPINIRDHNSRIPSPPKNPGIDLDIHLSR